MEVIQNGISKVVNELTKRKEIIVESSNINLDADKYNMVNQLIETSLNKRATEITKEDITLIDKSTLENDTFPNPFSSLNIYCWVATKYAFVVGVISFLSRNSSLNGSNFIYFLKK